MCVLLPFGMSQIHGQAVVKCVPTTTALHARPFGPSIFLLTSAPRFLFVAVKLNGNRTVTGLLRGFDQFMNLVLDETVEQVRPSTANALFCVALARRATLPPARCAHLRLE